MYAEFRITPAPSTVGVGAGAHDSPPHPHHRMPNYGASKAPPPTSSERKKYSSFCASAKFQPFLGSSFSPRSLLRGGPIRGCSGRVALLCLTAEEAGHKRVPGYPKRSAGCKAVPSAEATARHRKRIGLCAVPQIIEKAHRPRRWAFLQGVLERREVEKSSTKAKGSGSRLPPPFCLYPKTQFLTPNVINKNNLKTNDE